MDRVKLGERVRHLRKAAGYKSQEEFCAKAGFSMKVIRPIEAGDGNPTLESLETIASTLGIDVLDLLSDDATMHVHTDAKEIAREVAALLPKYSADEESLIRLFRRLSDDGKKAILLTLEERVGPDNLEPKKLGRG